MLTDDRFLEAILPDTQKIPNKHCSTQLSGTSITMYFFLCFVSCLT